MIIGWIVTASAVELTAGGFVGVHLAGPNHELYEAPDVAHGRLGPAFTPGLRAGVGSLGPLRLEGEVLGGPAAQVGGGGVFGARAQLLVVGGPVAGGRPFGAVGFGNLGIRSQALGNDIDRAAHAGVGGLWDLTDHLALRADLRWLVSSRVGPGRTYAHHQEVLVGLERRWSLKRRIQPEAVEPVVEPVVETCVPPVGDCPGAPVTVALEVVDQDGLAWEALPILSDGAVVGATDSEGRVLLPGRVGEPFDVRIAPDGAEASERQVEPSGTDDVVRWVVQRPMKTVVVEVQPASLVTLEPVLFEVGSERVLAASLPVLDAVAAALEDHPDILQVEVGGHASSEGTAAFNLALSERRVEEVVRLLVERGVEEERLSAKGYGEQAPAASNDTESGRRTNRRVSFTILERGGAGD